MRQAEQSSKMLRERRTKGRIFSEVLRRTSDVLLIEEGYQTIRHDDLACVERQTKVLMSMKVRTISTLEAYLVQKSEYLGCNRMALVSSH